MNLFSKMATTIVLSVLTTHSAIAYHNISPYTWCAGNPIKFVDQDGKEIRINLGSGEYLIYQDSELLTSDKKQYCGIDQYALNVQLDMNLLENDELLKQRIEDLEKSGNIHYIENTDGFNENQVENVEKERVHKPTGSTTRFNYANDETVNGDKFTPAVGLAHELLGHAWDADRGQTRFGETDGVPNCEIDAVTIENLARKLTGDPPRSTYGGKTINFNKK